MSRRFPQAEAAKHQLVLVNLQQIRGNFDFNPPVALGGGKAAGPVAKPVPGFEQGVGAGAGAGIGSAVQLMNSMLQSAIQGDELAKAKARLEQLEPEIARLLQEGNNVTVTIEVEWPTISQLRLVGDLSQIVYFRSMYIKRTQYIKPAPRWINPTTGQPVTSMSSGGFRDRGRV